MPGVTRIGSGDGRRRVLRDERMPTPAPISPMLRRRSRTSKYRSTASLPTGLHRRSLLLRGVPLGQTLGLRREHMPMTVSRLHLLCKVKFGISVFERGVSTGGGEEESGLVTPGQPRVVSPRGSADRYRLPL